MRARALVRSVSNDDKLELYSLFKQANVGDVNTCTPRARHVAQSGSRPAPRGWMRPGRLGPLSTRLTHSLARSLAHFAARPGMLDFTGKAKWDAWEKKKGAARSCLSVPH